MKKLLHKRIIHQNLATLYVTVVYFVFGLHYFIYGEKLQFSLLSFEGTLLIALGLLVAFKWNANITVSPHKLFRAVAVGWLILWSIIVLIQVFYISKASLYTDETVIDFLYILFLGSAYLFSFSEVMLKFNNTNIFYGAGTILFGISLLGGFDSSIFRIAYYVYVSLLIYQI